MTIREEIKKNMADSKQCYQYWKEKKLSPEKVKFYAGEISAFRFVLSILDKWERVGEVICTQGQEKIDLMNKTKSGDHIIIWRRKDESSSRTQ